MSNASIPSNQKFYFFCEVGEPKPNPPIDSFLKSKGITHRSLFLANMKTPYRFTGINSPPEYDDLTKFRNGFKKAGEPSPEKPEDLCIVQPEALNCPPLGRFEKSDFSSNETIIRFFQKKMEPSIKAYFVRSGIHLYRSLNLSYNIDEARFSAIYLAGGLPAQPEPAQRGFPVREKKPAYRYWFFFTMIGGLASVPLNWGERKPGSTEIVLRKDPPPLHEGNTAYEMLVLSALINDLARAGEKMPEHPQEVRLLQPSEWGGPPLGSIPQKDVPNAQAARKVFDTKMLPAINRFLPQQGIRSEMSCFFHYDAAWGVISALCRIK